jgi:hypothetical protein
MGISYFLNKLWFLKGVDVIYAQKSLKPDIFEWTLIK